MSSFYIIKGRVTCEDVAAIYSEMLGRTVRVGDPEWRVADHPERPSISYDFPSYALALACVSGMQALEGAA
jgi:hypothetical protein